MHIWIHDLACIDIFIGGNKNLAAQFYEDPSIFKNNILSFFIDKPNINFIFPSLYAKAIFSHFFANYGYNVHDKRLKVIYNILYKDEFQNKDENKDEFQNKDKIDKNKIVFASAWTKNTN